MPLTPTRCTACEVVYTPADGEPIAAFPHEVWCPFGKLLKKKDNRAALYVKKHGLPMQAMKTDGTWVPLVDVEKLRRKMQQEEPKP